MTANPEWIAVDWGTSNLRAWAMGPNGDIVFSRSSPEGMGKLQPHEFPRVLQDLLGGDLDGRAQPVETVICGMAGARQGWIEAPYLDAPADLAALARSSVRPENAGQGFSVRILPGVCQRTCGQEDVMRGEETQLLGLAALLPGFSGLVVMPGTHSKWVRLEGRRLVGFATAMTGELFEVLATHSVLRHSVAAKASGAERDEGFLAGLEASIAHPERLTSSLFKVRAGTLLSGRSADWSAGYLSGLLIGAEIGGQRSLLGSGEIPLVGGPSLCALYAKGFARLGLSTRIIDATDATLAGLKAARQGEQ